ncbi:MAG TPA: exodeoxyribonuclease VII large subunit [Candidatus Dormibacteraeota bacterium]|nr:exodeoxyribonuclease VII large subunit [Candidatus Dormibacteraeota bacterium]
MSQIPLNLQPTRHIWSVSEITARIKELLEAGFRELWVEGEISNFRQAQSGHLYFTLKDEHAQIRCVTFRNDARLLKFRPEDGLHVTVRGAMSLYEARGEYQVYVQHIEPMGLGALQLAFEQLRQRLESEGLFDAARKKPLPLLPRRIGLVTSPAGAAVRDVLRVLRRRFPGAHVVLYPVRVQGEGSAKEIVEAIRYLNRKRLADVLILARGGGSLEDLWSFNEEIVARAIAASLVPVVTGVGHETDFTIADFAADVRAPTPSAAAEIVVQTRQEFDRHIAELSRRMAERLRYLLLERRHRLGELSSDRAFGRLPDLVRQRRQQIDESALALAELLRGRLRSAQDRLVGVERRFSRIDLRVRLGALRLAIEQRRRDLGTAAERFFTARRQRLASLAVQLDERSPLRLLDRGYSLCYDAAGHLLRDAGQVSTGDEIAVRLARGRLTALIRKIEN